MKEAGRIGKYGPAVGVTLLLAVLALWGFLDSTRNTDAADSETAALIRYFNQYRSAHGLGPLTTDSQANASVQAWAQQTVSSCSYPSGPPPKPSGWGAYAAWESYGYTDAASLWAVYSSDSQVLGMIGNPNYNAVGVGRAYNQGCNWRWIWGIMIGHSNAPTPTPGPSITATPLRTASPTPTLIPTQPSSATPTPTTSAAPTPTPSSPATGTLTPTSTPVITQTADPSPMPTDMVTPTPSATPTLLPRKIGDGDCNGQVDMADGLLILKVSAGLAVGATCLDPHGVDCLGGIDVADVITMIYFLGDVPYALPSGCPPVGSDVQPSPTVTPSITPTPTSPPFPGQAGPCLLAVVAYDMYYGLSLDSTYSCASPDATYSCDFSAQASAVCVPAGPGADAYDCSFLSAGFGYCAASGDSASYSCANDEGVISCVPDQPGLQEYDCFVIADAVLCSPFPSGETALSCNKQDTVFDCSNS